MERTLSIIKPDAVSKLAIGEIYHRFEKAGLYIIAAKMIHLTPRQVQQFYFRHSSRSFYADLIKFMTSGPIMVQILEGEDAIAQHRELIGATDPQDAKVGTIRADFALNIDANAVHGSDSLETAREEIQFFFDPHEIYSRTRY